MTEINAIAKPETPGNRRRGRHRFRLEAVDKFVGEFVAIKRQRQGMTRKAVSEIIDLSAQMVARYESGEVSLSCSALYVFGAALDFSPHDALPPIEEVDEWQQQDDTGRNSVRYRRQTQQWSELLHQLPESQVPMMLKVVGDLVEGFQIKERVAQQHRKASQLAI